MGISVTAKVFLAIPLTTIPSARDCGLQRYRGLWGQTEKWQRSLLVSRNFRSLIFCVADPDAVGPTQPTFKDGFLPQPDSDFL